MPSDDPVRGPTSGINMMRSLAARSSASGRPHGWYEELYAAAEAGLVEVPWDHGEPTALLVEWLGTRNPRNETTAGGAVVVGCAYGDDAELLARHGYATTAFDVSASAIAAAQRRHPGSSVDYVRADLLDLPSRWLRRFDLVIECTTVQSMPAEFHSRAAAAVASLCADGGTVVVIERQATEHDPPGPPWLLTEEEIYSFGADGVELAVLETLPMGGGPRWRAELRRHK